MREAEKLFKEAFKHYKKSEDTDALKKVDEALKLHDKVERGHYLRAEILLMQRRLGMAELAFQKAIELEPAFAPAHDSLGVVHLVKKEYGSALKAFEKAIECDKRFGDAHLHLGMMYERQGKRNDAEKEYKLAVTLNPKSLLGHYRLRVFYLSAKPPDPKSAEKSFLIASKLDPRDAQMLFIYGYCLDAQDKHSAAQATYEKVLKIDPKYADAWRNKGIIHERQGSKKAYEEAIGCYEKYMECNGAEKALVKGWIAALKARIGN